MYWESIVITSYSIHYTKLYELSTKKDVVMDTGNTIAKEGAYSRFHSAITYYPLLLLFLTISNSIFCQNPIVPAGVYLADPSAHVWHDGKLYVYGSLDESTEYYCSYKYHVLSTSDLLHWDMEENVFASRGENDEVLYSDKELYAPDCQFKNGMYYLYYCLPDRKAAEGVATSKFPT